MVSWRSRGVGLAALLTACVGPPAPDVAVCTDLISRLCAAPRCPAAESGLAVGDTCEATVLARAGCGAEGFAFTTPTRARWLECRALVIRSGTGSDVHPSCDDVTQFLSQCSDLSAVLGAP